MFEEIKEGSKSAAGFDAPVVISLDIRRLSIISLSRAHVFLI